MQILFTGFAIPLVSGSAQITQDVQYAIGFGTVTPAPEVIALNLPIQATIALNLPVGQTPPVVIPPWVRV